jgi:hypothetical protein
MRYTARGPCRLSGLNSIRTGISCTDSPGHGLTAPAEGSAQTRCADAIAPGLVTFRCAAVAHCGSWLPSPRSRWSPASCGIASWPPFYLPLPLPVVGKSNARSTKPAQREPRGDVCAAVSVAPCAPCNAVCNRPPALPEGRPEALAPRVPVSPPPHPSCSACPARAVPRHTVRRAAERARRYGVCTSHEMLPTKCFLWVGVPMPISRCLGP